MPAGANERLLPSWWDTKAEAETYRDWLIEHRVRGCDLAVYESVEHVAGTIHDACGHRWGRHTRKGCTKPLCRCAVAGLVDELPRPVIDFDFAVKEVCERVGLIWLAAVKLAERYLEEIGE